MSQLYRVEEEGWQNPLAQLILLIAQHPELSSAAALAVALKCL